VTIPQDKGTTPIMTPINSAQRGPNDLPCAHHLVRRSPHRAIYFPRALASLFRNATTLWQILQYALSRLVIRHGLVPPLINAQRCIRETISFRKVVANRGSLAWRVYEDGVPSCPGVDRTILSTIISLRLVSQILLRNSIHS